MSSFSTPSSPDPRLPQRQSPPPIPNRNSLLLSWKQDKRTTTRKLHPQSPQMLPAPIPHERMPRSLTGCRGTEPDGFGPIQADPPMPGSSPPGGQPRFPTSQGSCEGLGLMRHERPVENEGHPSETKNQSHQRGTKKEELTLPSVFSTLSNTRSVNATDIQMARISAMWTWSRFRRLSRLSAISHSKTRSRLGNLSTRWDILRAVWIRAWKRRLTK